MSVLDVKVKSGESPKFYKSGINRLEKRIDKLEHQAFCCLPADIAAAEEEKVVLFTLTALATGLGNWQVMPAQGHEILPAPGAGKTYIITGMVAKLDVSVDITGAGLGTVGNVQLFADGFAAPLTAILATPSGVLAARLAQIPPITAMAFGENVALQVDHGAGTVADAAAVGTAKLTIFYKIVTV
jgi:hypothetical protein